MAQLFFTPKTGYAGDFVPFYQNGSFRLFYLHDFRNPEAYGDGMPWYRVDTKDFIHFEPEKEMLKKGGMEEQDLYVFTGSVIEKDGQYHIFYTGHNPRIMDRWPVQGIMHAVSSDLERWEKRPEDTFFSDNGIYERNDWRDPFVFYNEEKTEYWMLAAARVKDGPERRRGCTALCVSKDLVSWEIRQPFWSPGLWFTPECPDLFKMGDWWYLITSEFTDRNVTRYRMARSLEGPWLKPEIDTLDARAFYAAKTAASGDKRYLFGWLTTRTGETDSGNWQWGGSLVVHELQQRADGTLYPKMPEPLRKVQGKAVQPAPIKSKGMGSEGSKTLLEGVKGGFVYELYDELPARCRIETTFEWQSKQGEFGLLLHSDKAMDHQYMLRLNRDEARICFDGFPRGSEPVNLSQIWQKADLGSKTHKLTLLIEDDICVAYLDDETALSVRLYAREHHYWGVYAQEADIVLAKTVLTDLSD